MISSCELLPINRGLPDVCDLRRDWSNAVFAERGLFGRYRPHLDAAAAAVIAHSCVGDVHDFVVVHIVNDRSIHIGDAPVIFESVAIPIAAFITAAHISEAVVDSTVEAHMRTPVASVPQVTAAGKAPERRCPQCSDIRG